MTWKGMFEMRSVRPTTSPSGNMRSRTVWPMIATGAMLRTSSSVKEAPSTIGQSRMKK
jgi:hypothetical protein